jgi:hypothetical protein
MDDHIKTLSNRIDGLSNRINENEKASINRTDALSNKIDSINSILAARIDDLMKMAPEI